MTDKQKPKFLDRDHPFFAKTWVRVLTVAFPAAMVAVEFWGGNPFFGVLFGGAAAWALWELFLRK
jgi:hypothetical protein